MVRTLDDDIIKFIIDNVREHPSDIGPFVTDTFKVTRQTASNYLARLVRDGVLIGSGMTAARRYELARLAGLFEEITITADMEDDFIWTTKLRSELEPFLPKNVLDICQYAVTEMFNNVIDHSASETCTFSYERTAKDIEFWIIDYGVGVFEKIKSAFDLSDLRHALLELTKGKLTTDSSKHSGEGIFFTSRMMDFFALSSNGLLYQKRRSDDGWLVEVDEISNVPGTAIRMLIDVDAVQTLKGVFDQFSSGDDYSFAKTHVPLRLAKHEGDNLVSRSQAKRLLARVDKFSEVILDFAGIEEIGQAFADEIFRVYASAHPKIRIYPINTNASIDEMIRRAQRRNLDSK